MTINYVVENNGEQVFGPAEKEDAISHAAHMVVFDGFYNPVVKNTKTGQLIYMLPRDRSSCRVCGCDLGGHKYCPLCQRLHHYL